MPNELEKIRRQNRRFFLVLSFFIILILIGVVLSYARPDNSVVKNYTGKDGRDGQVDYSTIYNYVDSRIASLPKPQDGATGAQGATSTVPGPQGMSGADSSIAGPKGDNGENGQTPEFRCEPITHNYQWRYVGDDQWQNLQPNSKACTEND